MILPGTGELNIYGYVRSAIGDQRQASVEGVTAHQFGFDSWAPEVFLRPGNKGGAGRCRGAGVVRHRRPVAVLRQTLPIP
jgi:hypothetical protein